MPVFNAEKYLADCLDSLLAQNFKSGEYEIICVDDGSVDRSSKILQEYQKKSEFIRVISQKNAGVSTARNRGLDAARGRYLGFVDSDDIVRQNAYSSMISIMEENGSCLINFPYISFSYDIPETGERKLLFHENTDDKPWSSARVWDSIVRRDIIEHHQIRFQEEMRMGEDTLFMYYVSLYIDNSKLLFWDIPVYFYRQHTDSVMHQHGKGSVKQHMDDMMAMALSYKEMLARLDSSDWKYKSTFMRKEKAVIAAMFDAARMKDIGVNDYINGLRESQLYPKTVPWWSLRGAGMKSAFINAATLFFKYPFYYRMFCYLMRLLK